MTAHFFTRSQDIYYIAFPKDYWGLKGVVGLMYILEIVQLVIATRDGYESLATGWGDLAGLDQVRLEWLSVSISNTLSRSMSPSAVIL